MDSNGLNRGRKGGGDNERQMKNNGFNESRMKFCEMDDSTNHS